MSDAPKKLLIAASGTGGHVFPAIAVAEQLADYQIEWLGVSDRLETQLVPAQYYLNTVQVEGFQKRGLATLRVLFKFFTSIWQVRKLLQKGQFQGVFTTGGYIAAPAIIAARSLGLPTLLHESNAIPGKVTRWLSPWCSTVAVGFAAAVRFLPKARTVCVGTPVRQQFRVAAPPLEDLPIPNDAPLLVVVGGSQGAVAVNRMVRQAAPHWLEAGFWIVHLTGENDNEAKSLSHPHYIALPFYHNMAGLFQRADLAISRAGAGTLTELAIAGLPAILIPFPFAAEDHQAYNAAAFAEAGAALVFRQSELTPEQLETQVLSLMKAPELRQEMATKMQTLAVPDSAEQLATTLRTLLSA